MVVPTKVVVFPVFLCCVSFLKYSISENSEDCKKGKQYWSVKDILLESGTCVACPPDWKTCNDQPKEDKTSCLDSCHVVKSEKPKTKQKTNVTTVISEGSTSSKAPKVNNSNATSPVVYRPPVVPPETEVDEPKSPDAKENLGEEILIVVGCIFGLMLLIGAILLYRKIRKKIVQNRGERDEEVQLPLARLQDDRNHRELPDVPDNALDEQPAIVADEEELRPPIAEEQQRHIVHESSIEQQPIVQASGTNMDETHDTHEELNLSSNINLFEEQN